MYTQLRHTIFLSALLHDIEKIPQRAGKPNEFFEKYNKIIESVLKDKSNTCLDDTQIDSVETFIANQYTPKTETQALIMLANCWSGSSDSTAYYHLTNNKSIDKKQVTIGGGAEASRRVRI